MNLSGYNLSIFWLKIYRNITFQFEILTNLTKRQNKNFLIRKNAYFVTNSAYCVSHNTYPIASVTRILTGKSSLPGNWKTLPLCFSTEVQRAVCLALLQIFIGITIDAFIPMNTIISRRRKKSSFGHFMSSPYFPAVSDEIWSVFGL